ncbi:hypothetical protein Pelo_17534 [Pelomyxa schiedti]|nr:hypothetical protein Pelo_17534 [Pelomyxa schiedti]
MPVAVHSPSIATFTMSKFGITMEEIRHQFDDPGMIPTMSKYKPRLTDELMRSWLGHVPRCSLLVQELERGHLGHCDGHRVPEWPQFAGIGCNSNRARSSQTDVGELSTDVLEHVKLVYSVRLTFIDSLRTIEIIMSNFYHNRFFRASFAAGAMSQVPKLRMRYDTPTSIVENSTVAECFFDLYKKFKLLLYIPVTASFNRILWPMTIQISGDSELHQLFGIHSLFPFSRKIHAAEIRALVTKICLRSVRARLRTTIPQPQIILCSQYLLILEAILSFSMIHVYYASSFSVEAYATTHEAKKPAATDTSTAMVERAHPWAQPRSSKATHPSPK